MLKKTGKISRTALLSAVLCSGVTACSPYPDTGEFLAGVVFSGNFLAGVKALRPLPATGRNRGPGAPLPYTILASAGTSGAAVTTAAPASSPLWTDNGKRDPLAVASAAQVYVFDNDKGCAAPEDAPPFDPRWDIYDRSRQYPIFSDLPEIVSGMSGRAGRTGAFSAIVEVVHIPTPPGFACQSVKRADTVRGRADSDLKPAAAAQREYRLLLVVDTALTAPPLPFQLGWYNQLLLPYVDMGPVPVTADGKRFVTMPIYGVVGAGAMSPALRVVAGSALEGPFGGGLSYSPICQELTLPWPALKTGDPSTYPPTDAGAAPYPPYMEPPDAKAAGPLSACLVCFTTEAGYQCPFANSRAGAR